METGIELLSETTRNLIYTDTRVFTYWNHDDPYNKSHIEAFETYNFDKYLTETVIQTIADVMKTVRIFEQGRIKTSFTIGYDSNGRYFARFHFTEK